MKGGENETPVGYTPGTRAPDFTALALCEKEFKEVTLSSFQVFFGHYSYYNLY